MKKYLLRALVTIVDKYSLLFTTDDNEIKIDSVCDTHLNYTSIKSVTVTKWDLTMVLQMVYLLWKSQVVH